MMDDNARRLRANRVFLTQDACDLEDFRTLIDRRVDPADYPFAAGIVSNALVYDGDAVRDAASRPKTRRELMAEWVEALGDGPGVIVIRKAFADLRPIEAANARFWTMIEDQRRDQRAMAITSPSPAPTTASGMRWKSCASLIPRPSRPTTAIRPSRWRAKRGSAPSTRSLRSSTS